MMLQSDNAHSITRDASWIMTSGDVELHWIDETSQVAFKAVGDMRFKFVLSWHQLDAILMTLIRIRLRTNPKYDA